MDNGAASQGGVSSALRRELAEETGYVAGGIEVLGRFNPLPGMVE
jgi:8-oxo-dGTP pyrophosphatase MutT (NUDIX family)